MMLHLQIEAICGSLALKGGEIDAPRLGVKGGCARERKDGWRTKLKRGGDSPSVTMEARVEDSGSATSVSETGAASVEISALTGTRSVSGGGGDFAHLDNC